MYFSKFLQAIKLRNNLKTTSEFFAFLGAREKIDMGQRNLAMIESGDLLPTVSALGNITQSLRKEDFREAVLSFFKDNLDPEKHKRLLDYLDCNLLPGFNATEKKDSTASYIEMNEEQLSFLVENRSAMVLMNKIGLYEESKFDYNNVDSNLLDKLVELKLLTQDKSAIKPRSTNIRLPSFSKSSAKKVRLTSKFILNHIDAYLAEEGSENQEFAYSFYLLSPTQRKIILDEISRIKKLIFSFSAETTMGEANPFLFVGFGKELTKKDFE